MIKKRALALTSLMASASLPLWGGTGRPSDGLLSFILLLGSLLLVLGVLHLIDQIKCWARNILEGMY